MIVRRAAGIYSARDTLKFQTLYLSCILGISSGMLGFWAQKYSQIASFAVKSQSLKIQTLYFMPRMICATREKPGHRATRPPGHQATRPPGHQATRPPGHQATRPPGHQATRPPGHRIANTARRTVHVKQCALPCLLGDSLIFQTIAKRIGLQVSRRHGDAAKPSHCMGVCSAPAFKPYGGLPACQK